MLRAERKVRLDSVPKDEVSVTSWLLSRRSSVRAVVVPIGSGKACRVVRVYAARIRPQDKLTRSEATYHLHYTRAGGRAG